MSPAYHALVSGAAALTYGCWSQSPGAGVACFLSGIFIDVDHHIEYFIAKKKFPLDYKELVKFCAHHEDGKLLLIFHSYESLVILWLVIYYNQLGVVWSAFALGLTLHLIFDQFTNPLKPLSYFLTYRIYCGFERQKLFTSDYRKKHGKKHL